MAKEHMQPPKENRRYGMIFGILLLIVFLVMAGLYIGLPLANLFGD